LAISWIIFYYANPREEKAIVRAFGDSSENTPSPWQLKSREKTLKVVTLDIKDSDDATLVIKLCSSLLLRKRCTTPYYGFFLSIKS